MATIHARGRNTCEISAESYGRSGGSRRPFDEAAFDEVDGDTSDDDEADDSDADETDDSD